MTLRSGKACGISVVANKPGLIVVPVSHVVLGCCWCTWSVILFSFSVLLWCHDSIVPPLRPGVDLAAVNRTVVPAHGMSHSC